MSRGKIPKRSDERRKDRPSDDRIVLKKGESLPFTWTEPSWDWEPAIIRYYQSFEKSGMAAYYQQTDVEQLWIACNWLDRQEKSGRPSAMIIAEANKMLDGLGATEGERRRMRIELEEAKEEGPDLKVVAIKEAKDRLRKSG